MRPLGSTRPGGSGPAAHLLSAFPQVRALPVGCVSAGQSGFGACGEQLPAARRGVRFRRSGPPASAGDEGDPGRQPDILVGLAAVAHAVSRDDVVQRVRSTVGKRLEVIDGEAQRFEVVSLVIDRLTAVVAIRLRPVRTGRQPQRDDATVAVAGGGVAPYPIASPAPWCPHFTPAEVRQIRGNPQVRRGSGMGVPTREGILAGQDGHISVARFERRVSPGPGWLLAARPRCTHGSVLNMREISLRLSLICFSM